MSILITDLMVTDDFQQSAFYTICPEVTLPTSIFYLISQEPKTHLARLMETTK